MADYTPTQLASIARALQYNPSPYNQVSNPYGMAARGYKVNLTVSVGDVAIIAQGVKVQADDCKAQADRAVGAVSSRLLATSTSSLAIGTGSKVFTVAENLDTAVPIRVGDWVKAASTANANNYMWGVVTARTSSTLTINVTLTNGSGTLASWTLLTTGPDGPAVGIASVEADTAPKLGGNLDGQGRSISNTDLSPSIDEVSIYLGASLFA
ncbi:hypothetical protein JL101_036005 (plasmid) [Skermanella rosea]|uniref:hypothetical protein n=1 Tax=Skermanella rosea TaxID=1817965 RepID=UPI0019339087|nr:hypothetical protein [Skermanella rosea]UEM08058.1 hypothetical protein JL101_036005 [Skermanella rosea]